MGRAQDRDAEDRAQWRRHFPLHHPAVHPGQSPLTRRETCCGQPAPAECGHTRLPPKCGPTGELVLEFGRKQVGGVGHADHIHVAPLETARR